MFLQYNIFKFLKGFVGKPSQATENIFDEILNEEYIFFNYKIGSKDWIYNKMYKLKQSINYFRLVKILNLIKCIKYLSDINSFIRQYL